MENFSPALELICKYEGFNEKAYADPETGEFPYTLGFGTQFYPDGAPVKLGHYCTKQKALDYLLHEVNIIEQEIAKLNLRLDEHMKQALISFVHSVGWKPFLYSSLIDCIDIELTSHTCRLLIFSKAKHSNTWHQNDEWVCPTHCR
jgi:lysozyme